MKYRYIIIVAVCLILQGCAKTRIEYLEPEDFMSRARTMYSSASTEFYVGHSATRAYFEEQSFVFQTECTLYWTEVDALPDGFLENLESEREKYLKHIENIKNPNHH